MRLKKLLLVLCLPLFFGSRDPSSSEVLLTTKAQGKLNTKMVRKPSKHKIFAK